MRQAMGKQTPRPFTRQKSTLSSCSDSSEKGRYCDPVETYCRLRNLNEDKESTCIKLVSPNVLSLVSSQSREVQCSFKHIFTSYSSQKEVFDVVALPLLENLINGKSGLLFSYGVTGSGKTYTLTGDANNPGIMPRCIDTLFNSIQDFQAPKFVIKSDRMNGFEVQCDNDALSDRLTELKSTKSRTLKKTPSQNNLYLNDGAKIIGINENSLYAVFISYVEIYNNMVFDLLDESGGKVLQGKILREDCYKNMYINGVVEQEVKSSDEAYNLFFLGQKRKRMAHTILNSESSRSHSIFNIRVVQLEQLAHNSNGQAVIPEGNVLRVGRLSLVDLAGSERTNRTNNTGVRLKEASSINNSLMSLRNCIDILRDNQINGTNRLVPYRDTKLTHLFKNYFEGEGSVRIIVCLNPSIQDLEENLQVLKFAETTQEVKVAASETRFTPYRKIQKTPRMAATPVNSKRDVQVTSSAPLVFGPKLVINKFNLEDAHSCGEELIRITKILKARREKGFRFNEEVKQKEVQFRKRLHELNQESISFKPEIRTLKSLLKREQLKSQNLETKIVDLETCNDNLAVKQEELQGVVKSLRNIIDEKDMKLNQNLMEREKTKQHLVQQSVKMNQELDAKLRRQREQMEAAMLAKECKIRKMKQILDSDVSVVPLQSESMPDGMETGTQTLLYEPEASQMESQRSGHRRVIGTPKARSRRSRSAGEVWLEHNAIKPVPLGTVLQPSMKRRKSVTKLSKASDVTNPKQNKYCLIAQEPDTDGEMETKLYKGDIVQTCGGGAQVIFNDVERLRQESPTATPHK